MIAIFRSPIPFVLLLGLFFPGAAAGQAGQDRSSTEAEVLAVVEASLERISDEDMEGLAGLLAEGAIVAGIREGRPLWLRTREEEAAARPDADLVERGFDPDVRISGPVAMVWLPYDFYRDGAWSHCGVDVFSLARIDGTWTIVSILYSVEQPPACAPLKSRAKGRDPDSGVSR